MACCWVRVAGCLEEGCVRGGMHLQPCLMVVHHHHSHQQHRRQQQQQHVSMPKNFSSTFFVGQIPLHCFNILVPMMTKSVRRKAMMKKRGGQGGGGVSPPTSTERWATDAITWWMRHEYTGKWLRRKVCCYIRARMMTLINLK